MPDKSNDSTSDIQDAESILREMMDYDGVVEDFAYRLAFSLKHKCRNCPIVESEHDRYVKQGELMAETARQNVRLRKALGKIYDATKSAYRYQYVDKAYIHSLAAESLGEPQK